MEREEVVELEEEEKRKRHRYTGESDYHKTNITYDDYLSATGGYDKSKITYNDYVYATELVKSTKNRIYAIFTRVLVLLTITGILAITAIFNNNNNTPSGSIIDYLVRGPNITYTDNASSSGDSY